VQSACRLARLRSGITKPLTPHSLRHNAFAVHLSRPVRIYAPFGSPSGIVSWRPPPGISGSRRRKRARPPVRSICCSAGIVDLHALKTRRGTSSDRGGPIFSVATERPSVTRRVSALNGIAPGMTAIEQCPTPPSTAMWSAATVSATRASGSIRAASGTGRAANPWHVLIGSPAPRLGSSLS
jgi:hypothetical protein